MRSRSCIVIFLLAIFYVSASVAANPSAASDQAVVDEQSIEDAVDQLKADPNLATERKTRVLRWKTKDQEPPPVTDTPAWLRWILDFFSWLNESARALVWLAAGVFAAILVVWIVRYVRGFDVKLGTHIINVPTHVRDLDIRPESLPQDIGRAASELWERGEHRAALSLLYRGLLSRLVHRYAVPIRHSSTEGECRDLALKHLPAHSHSYIALLIRVWQDAVYGGKNPDTERVQELCAQFAMLDDLPAPTPHRVPDGFAVAQSSGS